jgi:hypothetical protein
MGSLLWHPAPQTGSSVLVQDLWFVFTRYTPGVDGVNILLFIS